MSIYIDGDLTPPISSVDIPGGKYTDSVDVIISSVDNDSSVISLFYTTDGSDPLTSVTVSSGLPPVYFIITNQRTLKYYAVNFSGVAETPKTDTYIILIMPDDIAVYNNPADLSTGDTIRIVFPEEKKAGINIYNVRGVPVKTYSEKTYFAGEIVEWDGTYKDSSEPVGTGIYFLIVDIEGEQKLRKIKLIIKQ